MARPHWVHSVVTRLTLAFCLGGLLLSIAMGGLTYLSTMHLFEARSRQQLMLMVHDLHEVALPWVDSPRTEPLKAALRMFLHDQRVLAARLDRVDGEMVSVGDWPERMGEMDLWQVNPDQRENDHRLDLTRPTLMVVAYRQPRGTHTLKLLIDGPAIRQEMWRLVGQQLLVTWLVLAVLTLTGLLLLRWWLKNPLGRIMQLAREDAPAAAFEHTAEEMIDEFGHLARAIGRMLHRLDETTWRLGLRERAFESLYQYAPTAMLSIGQTGQIESANRRAAALFGVPDQDHLLHQQILDRICREDRGRFRQFLDRMPQNSISRCELHMWIDDQPHEVAVELAAVPDDEGNPSQVRLSLQDVSEPNQLIRRVHDQRRMLDLVIEHMSEAILLVGQDGRTIRANQHLCRLLKLDAASIDNMTFEPDEFFAALDPLNAEDFASRIKRFATEQRQSHQEQFRCRDGVFLLQAIPVTEGPEEVIGQLWVVREVSRQAQNQQQLEQVSQQMRLLHHVVHDIATSGSMDELLERAAHQLYTMLDVDVVGVAMRWRSSERVNLQVIHPGSNHQLLEVGRELAEGVSLNLMPETLRYQALSYWPDLPERERWTQPFRRAGIESLATTTLSCRNMAYGIVWIGRRGGKRIERHQLTLLEALAPVIALGCRDVTTHTQLRHLRLTDSAADLPSPRRLAMAVHRLSQGASGPGALMLLRLTTSDASDDMLTSSDVLPHLVELFQDECRALDQLMRYDGQTLAMICPGTDRAAAEALGQRLLKRIVPLTVNHLRIAPDQVDCRIGVAAWPEDDHRGEPLIRLALQRLEQPRHQNQPLA